MTWCHLALHGWRYDGPHRACARCGCREMMIDAGGGVTGAAWASDPPRPLGLGYWLALAMFCASIAAMIVWGTVC